MATLIANFEDISGIKAFDAGQKFQITMEEEAEGEKKTVSSVVALKSLRKDDPDKLKFYIYVYSNIPFILAFSSLTMHGHSVQSRPAKPFSKLRA